MIPKFAALIQHRRHCRVCHSNFLEFAPQFRDQRFDHADLASPSSTNMRRPLVTWLELGPTWRLKPSARLAKGEILLMFPTIS
jgi:hypothetical protein